MFLGRRLLHFLFCFLLVGMWRDGWMDGFSFGKADYDLQSHGHEETDSSVGETEFSEE